MSEKFNPQGINGRDCPLCYRQGSLKAELGDATQLHCLGCAAVFLVLGGALERVPTPPVRRLTLAEIDRARGGAAGTYREPVDMVCRVCGAKHCHGHPQEEGIGR